MNRYVFHSLALLLSVSCDTARVRKVGACYKNITTGEVYEMIRQEGHHAIVKNLKNGKQEKIWNREFEKVACPQLN